MRKAVYDVHRRQTSQPARQAIYRGFGRQVQEQGEAAVPETGGHIERGAARKPAGKVTGRAGKRIGGAPATAGAVLDGS